jgi:hypothetical protein
MALILVSLNCTRRPSASGFCFERGDDEREMREVIFSPVVDRRASRGLYFSCI